MHDDETQRIGVHRKALGVGWGITPWNIPLLLTAFKFAPALLLGNSFILKPAPTTPITSLMLAKFAKDIFPGGVFNVLTDVNDLGPLLTAHPDIAKISFTGHTATRSAERREGKECGSKVRFRCAPYQSIKHNNRQT